jgi:class 3 adenylate cyclase
VLTEAIRGAARVVVGKIGDDLRTDYTAQGHTVGLAERMEQLASPGSAYATEHTGRLVSLGCADDARSSGAAFNA